jgi:endo-1,4-beta-xylanase
MTWAGSCTLDGQTSAIPYGGIGGTSEPVIAGLTLPFSDPATCTVTVTAGASGGSGEYPDNVYLTVTSDGQPVTSATPSASPSPSPSPSATPSPSAAPVHLVRGFDGTCLRDTGDSAAERTKIVIWACDPTAQGQGWTYRGDELRIRGDMCVNAKGRGTSGSPAILWRCNGSPNEIWIHESDGEYVLKVNGYKLCLTDPAYSVSNGTQAVVRACADARDQRWSLP